MRKSSVAGLMAVTAAMSIAPLLTGAQGDSSRGTVSLITGEGNLELSRGDSRCTATSTGTGDSDRAIVIAADDNCSAWTTSSPIPRALSVRIADDKITFRENGRWYAIHDADTIQRAREIVEPVREGARKQEELGHRMSDLGGGMRDVGGQMRGAAWSDQRKKIKIPDMTEDFKRVEAESKRLSEEGGTQDELSELQSDLSELQGQLSELESEASEVKSDFSEREANLNDQMAAMSRNMNAMSRQMRAMSSETQGAAEKAARQMKDLLDRAKANGLARAE